MPAGKDAVVICGALLPPPPLLLPPVLLKEPEPHEVVSSEKAKRQTTRRSIQLFRLVIEIKPPWDRFGKLQKCFERLWDQPGGNCRLRSVERSLGILDDFFVTCSVGSHGSENLQTNIAIIGTAMVLCKWPVRDTQLHARVTSQITKMPCHMQVSSWEAMPRQPFSICSCFTRLPNFTSNPGLLSK